MNKAFALPLAAIAMAAVLAPVPSTADPLNLSVGLDRAAPVYAVGEGLSLTIRTQREAAIRVWLVDAKGKLSRVAPDTADGAPLHARPGEPLRVPERGVLRVTPPPGRYELRIIAQAWTGESRSLSDADARLPGQDVREQKTVVFNVEDATR